MTVTKRSVLAPVGDADHDPGRVEVLQDVGSEPGFFQGSGRQRIDENVGIPDQLTGRRHVALTREVEHRALFAGVEVLEQTRPIGIRNATGKRAPAPQRVSVMREFPWPSVPCIAEVR